MAPAVPYALLGAVELTAVAVWLGLATAACFPRLRRPTTPLLVLGSLGMAVAEAVTALRLSVGSPAGLSALRVAALVLVAVGIGFGGLSLRRMSPPAVTMPAGVAAGLFLTAVATGLAGVADHDHAVALALLSVRATASLCFAVVLVALARTNLLGKIVGAIVTGVVVMAVGAVLVVGAGAGGGQHDQSTLRRLLVTALIVLALVAGLAVVMARRIAEPLHRLTIAAGRVRRGDLGASVTVDSRDEVGSLGRAFDAMTASLRGLTGDLRDAADQEAALRARLQTVVASMTDGLLTTDSDGRVTSANSRALELLGSSETDVLGCRLVDVADLRDAGGASVLDGETWIDTDATLRRDGDVDAERPVRVAVAPLEDGGGLVVLLADRTREREVERMKTEFLATISHELRTPLTPIRGYAELLARNPHLSSARAQEFLGEILLSTARMSRAVDLLVDVAALEAGRVVPVRRTVPVDFVVDERLAAWRARYPDRSMDLRRRVASALPDLDVDPYWLTKALDELVDNAMKYSAPGSTITIDVRSGENGMVRLALRDKGRGVDTARIAELLGDFSQADGSETRRDGGMGLGLGFVTRVADPLGMIVRVSSRLGVGSEFSLDIPATAADPR